MSGEDALFGLKLLCRNRQSVRPGERNLSYLMDEEDEEQLILLLFISDVGAQAGCEVTTTPHG